MEGGTKSGAKTREVTDISQARNEIEPTKEQYDVFHPRTYLMEYFAQIGDSLDHEIAVHLEFPARLLRENDFSRSLILDFGCGPVLCGVIPFAEQSREIHISDFVPANLVEIRRWIDNDADAFDWSPHFRHLLEREAGQVGRSGPIDPATVAAREALLRRKITRLVQADLRQPQPLGPEAARRYDVVISTYCLDAVAGSLSEWQVLLGHLTSMLKPGGFLVYSSVINAEAYQVGDTVYKTLHITETDLREGFVAAGFQPSSIELEVCPLVRSARDWYSHSAFISARLAD